MSVIGRILLAAATLHAPQGLPPGDYDVVPTATSTPSTAPPSTTLPSPTTSSTVAPPTTTSTTAAPVPTTTSTTLQVGALYVSVSGSDGNPGTRAAPLRTGAAAAGKVLPGGAIVFLDNPDSLSHTLTRFACGGSAPCDGGGNMRCGTAVAPITIRAEHEGGAAFLSPGNKPAFELAFCRNIVVTGLFWRSKDDPGTTTGAGHTAFIHDSDHLKILRNVSQFNNRCGNFHVLRFENVDDSEIVENGCYFNSRHCISLHDGNGNFVARNYGDNGSRGPSGDAACLGADGKPRGGTSQEMLTPYPGHDNLFVNNFIEGSKGWGLSVNGTNVTDRNQIVGNAFVGTFLGIKVFTREGGSVVGTIVRDNVIARTTGSMMVRDSVTKGTLYERLTGFGNKYGFVVDSPTPSSTQASCAAVSPTLTLKDSLVTGTLTGPNVDVKPCDGTATRRCTLGRVRAGSYGNLAATCAGSGPDECDCTDKGTSIPVELGDSGAGRCLVDVPGDLGADVRCVLARDAQGDLVKTTMPLFGADGQLRFCPPVRPGWNDDAEDCRNYAARRLNHKPDGSGCPPVRWACL